LSSKAKKAEPKAAPAASAKPKAASAEKVEAKPKTSGDGTLYIDATGLVAGRLSSIVASEIIRGKRIVVLNAEKAVISGNRDTIKDAWKQRLELGSKVNPMYGPFHPRRPDNIVWRMVRGMVPKEKAKGTEGLKRLRVYMGVPEKYSGVTMSKFDKAMATRPLPVYTTIAEVSKAIGWNG